jgi:hypothetical protein
MLAWGLSAFLNWSSLDAYFRQFNGHTQVNATDLRSLRYPNREALVALGRRLQGTLPAQEALDALVATTLKVKEGAEKGTDAFRHATVRFFSGKEQFPGRMREARRIRDDTRESRRAAT